MIFLEGVGFPFFEVLAEPRELRPSKRDNEQPGLQIRLKLLLFDVLRGAIYICAHVADAARKGRINDVAAAVGQRGRDCGFY